MKTKKELNLSQGVIEFRGGLWLKDKSRRLTVFDDIHEYGKVNELDVMEANKEVNQTREYIVRAVNAHEELVSLLKSALITKTLTERQIELFKQAIAKAEGK